MNNLIYNARMALRDIMEVNIFTKGNDRVYLTVSPDLVWEGSLPDGADRARTEKVIIDIVARLRDMDMVLAGGQDAIGALVESEAVEIVRKAA